MKVLKQILGLLLVLLITGFLAYPAGAHSNFSSPNYIGVDDVQDSGGDRANSASYNVLSAICQTGIDALVSGNYKNFAGFLHPLLSTTPTPTITMSPTTSETFTHSPTATDTPTITGTPTITLTATITKTKTPTSTLTPTATITITSTSIVWKGSGSVFYPNPAKIGDPAYFQVRLETAGQVIVTIYNAAGERAAEVKADCQPGIAQLSLGTESLSAGIYYYRISIDGKSLEIKKMVLLK